MSIIKTQINFPYPCWFVLNYFCLKLILWIDVAVVLRGTGHVHGS